MSLYSEQYDDVYFSRNGGLAETKHVFLEGNNLPVAWQGKKRFCIAETGFGTGLNMLAAAKLFSQTAKNGQYLDLVSVELHPLEAGQIQAALAEWADALYPFVDRLVDNYPILTQGFHRLWLAPTICLTLIIGDAAQSYAQVNTQVDSWFLDGFTPVKNPAMWTPSLYKQIARLSHAGTSLATFTVARSVREGLEEVGFTVQKRPGFAYRRHCLNGTFTRDLIHTPAPRPAPSYVRILGAGIAGVSCAYLLNQHGIKTQLVDTAGTAGAGASGNLLGMVGPRILSPTSPQHSFYATAFDFSRRFYLSTGLSTVLNTPHIHLDHGNKFRTMRMHAVSPYWPGSFVSHATGHDLGLNNIVKENIEALVFHDCLCVSPKETCQNLSTGLHTEPTPLTGADHITVHATGHNHPLLKPMRGQTAWMLSTTHSSTLKSIINFGGYYTPAHPKLGLHVLGATFDRGDSDSTIRDADVAKLIQTAAPFLHEDILNAGVKTSWAGVRAQSPDKFPLIGFADSSTYLSTGHGSHGLTSAPMAAEILLSNLLGITCPVSADSLACVSPKRFLVDMNDQNKNN